MVRLIRISPESPLFPAAFALYKRTFPPEERRDQKEQLRVMREEDYHYCVLEENGAFLGIMLYWELGTLCYLEHFAIREDLRGEGIGTKALDLLKGQKKQIVLEIEKPQTEQQKKRRSFYLRNGFTENPHDHIQVKFHPNDPDLPLLLLSQGRALTAREYNDFRQLLEIQLKAPTVSKRP